MPFFISRDDITTLKTDAIVNAGNRELRMGGGVCGAIFKAAGAEEMERALQSIGPIRIGDAVATPGFALPARYVIQGTKGYILQKSTANWCGGVTFHPNQGKEEHFNLNGGRPRQAAEFHAFARAIEGGDQELCSRMLDTSVAVSRVLTVARRSAGIKFPCDR